MKTADPFVQLAKQAVETYVRKGRTIRISGAVAPELTTRTAGVFVTIFSGEALRGCIGTFLPTKRNIAEEIVQNAVWACSEDHRFSTISVEELPSLRYEVSVLSEPEPLADRSKHDPRTHGLIVEGSGGKKGLLLPGLDGIDSFEEQFSIACRKGRIDPSREAIRLFCFTTEKH